MTTKARVPSESAGGQFREFEHTGDLGIEVTAETRLELFRQAALALAAILVESATVEPIAERELVIRAACDTDLMHDLLSELLNLFLLEAFIWRDVSVEEVEAGLAVRLHGETFDASRHSFRGEIKAVTYHQLVVEHSPDGWRARVIFDV